MIEREFGILVELLFRAYTEAELIEKCMGTKVIKLDSKKRDSFQFETKNPKGNFRGYNGVIHKHLLDERITRTFEIDDSSFPVHRKLVSGTR